MSIKSRRFLQLPDLPSGHILNACKGWLSVIKPIARTNEVTNPSLETATTNYTAGSGTLTRSTEQQYHGAYSAKYVPSTGTTDGFFYGTISTTSGQTRAISCKFYGAAGVPYALTFATTGGVDLIVKPFIGTGRWQWIYLYYTETSTTSRRIYFRKNGSASTAAFYVDGVQSEVINAGETVSTYIDGDQQSLLIFGQFPPAYTWSGTRHASTSARTAQTRDGGMVFNLDFYQFLVTAVAGLGIATPSHVTVVAPTIDGSFYQGSIVPSRAFTISGRFNTRTNYELKAQRKALGQALNLDATLPRQPVALLYQEYDGTTPQGDTGKLIASYDGGGLAGKWDNLVGEQSDVTFQMWLPFLTGNERGSSVTQQASFSIGDVTAFITRSATGVWSQIAANATAASIYDIVQHPNGTFYIVGDFTTLGGTAANRITNYNPTTGTFTALGTGLNGIGRKVKIGPNGDVFVCGDFTTAGGTTVNRVARWDGATWNAMGSGGTKGVDNSALGMTLDAAGNVYVTGTFLNAGGAGATRIALWTASTNAWSALSSGLNGQGTVLATGLSGTIYVGGDFTTAGGTSAPDLASWNGSTFTALTTGLGAGADSVIAMAIAPNGDLYIGGTFTTISSQTVNNVARWNGFQWTSLGTGIGGPVGTGVNELVFAPDGMLWAGGSWSTLNNISTTIGLGMWNGSSWTLPDLTLPTASTAQIYALTLTQKGEIYAAGVNLSASNATAASTQTFTNDGTALTYPTFYITGPSSGSASLVQMRNIEAARVVSFNLSINALEVITIRCAPGLITMTSSFRGDITSAIIPGSSGDFPLIYGSNTITFYATGSTATIDAVWPRRFSDASDLIY